MKLIISLLFLFPLQLISMNELSPELNIEAQKIETDCCNVINKIFKQARVSLEAKEEIINPQWLGRQEIKDLQNCISDGTIIFDFDAQVKNVLPKRLESYLQTKIQEEAEILFENNKLNADGAKQFFYLSRTLCGLSKIPHYHEMIRRIKKEHSVPLLKLKLQEKVERHQRKEDMIQLCDNIVMGALPRK